MYRLRATSGLRGIFLVLSVLAAVSGCRTCNNITPGAIPQPNGTYACQWIHAEKARADQDKFVIYQYEWMSPEVTKLTPSGQGHVAQIAQELCQTPFPVVIEPSSDRRVDEWRRAAILEALAGSGNPVPPDRVILGRPEAEGLYGQEAPGVARGMLSNQTGGQNTGTGTLGTGGTLGGIQGSMYGGTGGALGPAAVSAVEQAFTKGGDNVADGPRKVSLSGPACSACHRAWAALLPASCPHNSLGWRKRLPTNRTYRKMFPASYLPRRPRERAWWPPRNWKRTDTCNRPFCSMKRRETTIRPQNPSLTTSPCYTTLRATVPGRWRSTTKH